MKNNQKPFVFLLGIFFFMTVACWLSLTSEYNLAIQREQKAYFDKINKEQSTDAAKRAWERLYKQHGKPAGVVYEQGETPWYIDAQGRKCKFV